MGNQSINRYLLILQPFSKLLRSTLLLILLAGLLVNSYAQQPGTKRYLIEENKEQKIKAEKALESQRANLELVAAQLTQLQKKNLEHQKLPDIDRRCGFEYANALRMQKNPAVLPQREFEEWIQRKQLLSNKREDTIATIPVVVHVIHNGEEEGEGANISFAQVLSQLSILNEDFRRTNADAVNTPDVFAGVAADAQIEFCLAKVDPDGNPTNGVNRVDGGQDSYTIGDMEGGIKQNTIWHPFFYMNIWVANLEDGLLGYAQFPDASGLDGMPAIGGSAATDGIVVTHTAFGNTGTAAAPFDLGRTATHEVGHYFGLRHIGGDGGCGVDDFVDDTPVQNDQNLTSDPCTFPGDNDCDEGPGDLPDMFQNYMDYSDDACMNLFTLGQKARFDAVLMNSPRRVELLSSQVCDSVPPDYVFEIPIPENDQCAEAFAIACGDTVVGSTVDATNFGSPDFCGTAPQAPGLWYNFTAGGEEVTLSLCGSDYDTKINVYAGDCESLVCVTGNDDACGLQSEVFFPSDSGATYYIYVNGFGSSVGQFELTIDCRVPGPPPENDLCENAIPIACDDFVIGTTNDATFTGAPTDGCGTIPTAGGVWYSFVGTGQITTASTCDFADYDTKINVYGGSCDSLTCVAGNNNAPDCEGNTSEVSFFAEEGAMYYIYINGERGLTGEFGLEITCEDPSANDICDKATPISCGDVITASTELATATGAPDTDCEPGFLDDNLGAGLWYQIIGTGESISLSTCGTAGFDTKIDVFTGDCDSLVCVAGNDDGDGCAAFSSFLTFPSVEGERYYIYVSGFAGAVGTFTLSVCPSCEITGLEIDPFFNEAICNDGTFGPTGTYFVSIKVDGITPSNIPRDEFGAIDASGFDVQINGVSYPIIEANFDNTTLPGESFFYVIANEVPGTGAEGTDVTVTLDDGCTYTQNDLFDAPECPGAPCTVNEFTVIDGPTCNGDGTFDICFYVDGVGFPKSSDNFSSEKFFIGGKERQETSYEAVEGGANICFTLPNDLELNNGNVDAFIQLGIDCKLYVSQSFTPPACNTRFASTKENVVALAQAVRIYPNPAKDQLTIEVGSIEAGKIQVLNAIGQVVHKGTLNANSRQKMDLSAYGQGLFIVRIIGDGTAVEEKVIVQ